MIKIKSIPVGYPAIQANSINIRIMPFQTTDTSCNTYYELFETKTVITKETTVKTVIDEETKNMSVVNEETEIETEVKTKIADGNIPITEEQYALWGDDNTYIEDIVLASLQLERL